MIKGVIFDADGTLLDSMSIWRDAVEQYLRQFGYKLSDEAYTAMSAMSMEQGSQYLKESYRLKSPTNEIKEGVLGLIEDFYRHRVSCKKGVPDFLRQLSEKGIEAVVATSGDKQLLEEAFLRLNIRQYFKGIFTCTELHTDKNQPDIYLRAAECLGTLPRETLVFEDVLHAVKTAKAAGFAVVAVEDLQSAADHETIRQLADDFITDFTTVHFHF